MGAVNGEFKEDSMSLEEGKVILRWPDKLSRESLGYLKTWLEFVIHRLEGAKPPIDSEELTKPRV